MKAPPLPTLLDLIEENNRMKVEAINLRMDLRTVCNLIATARMSIEACDYAYANQLLGSTIDTLKEKI